MISQNQVATLDTKTLQDAVNESIYKGRNLTDFDGRKFYWELEESAKASASGVKRGEILAIQHMRRYITYRAYMGAEKCFASQERICADLGYTCRKTVRWMIRVLVWAKHIIKLPNSKYGTNQYAPNPNLDEYQDITPQLIAKAKAFRLVSQKEEEVNQAEENNLSFFESSDEGISLTNIPKNIYIEEELETYQQDTNTESFNNPTSLGDAPLDATHLIDNREDVVNINGVDILIDEEEQPEPDTVNIPVKLLGYSKLQAIAAREGLNTIQQALGYLVNKDAESQKKQEESKSQSPIEEVATLDATQPTKVIEKEVELLNLLIPPTPQKRVYREYELIQQQAKIKNYLADKQKEFDIPGVDDLISREKHRITRLPDDLLMSYPIPNPGVEEALKGIVEQGKVKDKRKSLCKEFFEWLNECQSLDQCYAVLSAMCDALTRNDSEIMSYIPC